MKAVSADLLANVTGTYDKTMTTKYGNVIEQEVNGYDVISPSLIQFIDTLSDFGVTPLHAYASPNGRLFITNTVTNGQGVSIVLYSFNYSTGAHSMLGGIKYNLIAAGTTYTIRQIKAFDTGVTGWKILISCIHTTAANGGLYMINNVALSNFVLVSFPTIPLATTGDTQASQKVFHLIETGGTNLLTVAQGHAISSDRKVYVGHNPIATFVIYKFDIDATISTVTAGGDTADCFVFKTGTLGTPAGMLGVILLVNSFDIGTPSSGPNAGFECMYVPGTLGFNEFRLSDLSSGVTSLPSLRTCNPSDTTNMFTAQTPASANYSEVLDRILFQAAGKIMVKPFANNTIELYLGNASPQYRTAIADLVYDYSGVTVSSTEQRNGWIFSVTTTAGQIGIIAMDVRSEQTYNYSYFVTKVMETIDSQWISIRVNNRLRGSSNPLKLYYKASNTYSDTIFDNPLTGWTAIPNDYDLSEIASYNYIQLKGAYIGNANPSAIYAQPSEIRIIYQPNSETSDKYQYIHAFSSESTPAKWAWRQKSLYNGTPPTQHVRLYDTTSPTPLLFGAFDSVTDSSKFTYSTDGGMSFSPGIGPDTVGKIIVFTLTSPPGYALVGSMRES